MATKNCSEMDSSYPKWSKVMLNDSKELRKKQSRDCGRKYNRRLFSQMKSTPIPNRLRSKPAFYQRYMAKPRRGTPSNQKTAPKQPKPNTGSEWKKEYDVWNMIVQALDQSLLTNHKVNWPNKVIGIRDSNDNIQLIHNREELQQQALVASNGLRTHFNDLLNANDSNDDFSLKMKFKLVPVLETLTLVNESTETPYTFAGDINDLNNNNNVMQCEHFEVNKVDGEKEDSKEDDTLNNVNNHESTQNITCEKTLTNDSCSTWETCSDVDSYDYSLFCNDITPASSSTFISDGNDMEITPAVVHEIENISLLMAPNGKPPLDSKTFFDSPLPCFARKEPIASDTEPRLDEIHKVIKLCHNARATLQTLYNKVNLIEDRCVSWLRQNDSLNVSELMSGFDFLSDSLDLM